MEKEEYIKPIIEIIELSDAEIVTASLEETEPEEGWD